MITFREIEPELTPQQWQKIRHDVGRALDNSANTCWPEDVRTALADGVWELVLIEEDGKYRGCIVLSVAQYIRKRALNVVILAGKNLLEIGETIQRWLEAVARRANCSMIEMNGRLGWGKELRKHGWNPVIASMTYEVNSDGRVNSLPTGQ